ncbi:MAG: hypothetical protein AUH29_17115 [Candidatus Rokubacteria bacterium 13_1_40CM_69_27]|nr:MAG: hypothetical protein AUH29_17115 [Candidatus Rokubacteria bacterium 13_1_40CM_69_27]
MPEPLVLVMAAFALLSVVLLVAALAAVRKRRLIGTGVALVLALLFLALAALAATLGVATRGYRALTREVVAATVVTRPTGPERFLATFTFPDGRRELYELTGNALYVDAHIVKWHPLANILGLHTAYQLDRVSGRYDRLEDEQTKPRRMFTLSRPTPVDMFQLARSLAFLGRVVDTEYGSATFIAARGPAELELRVSTSGLLFRPVGQTAEGVSTAPARQR